METETRYQRIAREQRERQEARKKARKPMRRSGAPYTAEQRIADRIDGYDRDDLGPSGDY